MGGGRCGEAHLWNPCSCLTSSSALWACTVSTHLKLPWNATFQVLVAPKIMRGHVGPAFLPLLSPSCLSARPRQCWCQLCSIVHEDWVLTGDQPGAWGTKRCACQLACRCSMPSKWTVVARPHSAGQRGVGGSGFRGSGSCPKPQALQQPSAPVLAWFWVHVFATFVDCLPWVTSKVPLCHRIGTGTCICAELN